MEEIVKPDKGFVKYFFFLAGILATLAYRVIIVLNFYDPLLVKIAWYIGTIGFILYFGHRFEIQRRTSKIVEDYGLINVIKKTKQIKGKERKALLYVLKTTFTSKAKWNSAFIFILSILALIIGILLDLGVFG